MDKTEQLLKKLTEANGVSGYEGEIRKIMAKELRGSVDKLGYDRLGSVYGVKRGDAESPRVMLISHLDEIGFMVKEITPEGYLKFLPLGGWWGHVALGQRMRIITSKGTIIGVTGSRPPHLLPPKDREKVLDIADMFIDVGVQEKYDVTKRLGIRPGDPIVPDSNFTIMGNKKMYMSKAFDNRMACAAVVEVAQKLKKARHPNTFLPCASVQEEVGLRGAQTLAHVTEPDICIVCDTGIAQDVPPNDYNKVEKIGAGPAILLFDGSMIPNIKLRDFVIETAEKRKIPYHVTVMIKGGTDGGRVHVNRGGVPSIVIGTPVRYIHSHNSILNRVDYDNTVKLITEVIKRLDSKTVKAIAEN